MILTEQERKQALRSGLLGAHTTHSEQYLTSPLFRQKIDILIGMLPAWVDGLSKEAFEQEQRFNLEAVKAHLMSMPLRIPNNYIQGG